MLYLLIGEWFCSEALSRPFAQDSSVFLQTRWLQLVVEVLPAHRSSRFLPPLTIAHLGRRRLQRNCYRQSMGRVHCSGMRRRVARHRAAPRFLCRLWPHFLFSTREIQTLQIAPSTGAVPLLILTQDCSDAIPDENSQSSLQETIAKALKHIDRCRVSHTGS
jgi:hypothetical protein